MRGFLACRRSNPSPTWSRSTEVDKASLNKLWCSMMYCRGRGRGGGHSTPGSFKKPQIKSRSESQQRGLSLLWRNGVTQRYSAGIRVKKEALVTNCKAAHYPTLDRRDWKNHGKFPKVHGIILQRILKVNIVRVNESPQWNKMAGIWLWILREGFVESEIWGSLSGTVENSHLVGCAAVPVDTSVKA